MSQQCTGAGSLALAHQQTALHCYWCKGHVRVYNCAGMWRLLTTNILSDSAHLSASTQPHSPQINSSLRRAAKYHRTVLACCLEAWVRVFRFQISEQSIAASRHCRAASEHRAAAALQHASFLTVYSPTCLCCSCDRTLAR